MKYVWLCSMKTPAVPTMPMAVHETSEGARRWLRDVSFGASNIYTYAENGEPVWMYFECGDLGYEATRFPLED